MSYLREAIFFLIKLILKYQVNKTFSFVRNLTLFLPFFILINIFPDVLNKEKIWLTFPFRIYRCEDTDLRLYVKFCGRLYN